MRTVVLLATLLIARASLADEGMWTLDNFPTATVKARYGFEPSPAWLDHVRLGSVRLAQGCSASFVSSRGLLLTNHHCAHACTEQLSSAKRDYVANGFYAKRERDELGCPELEANQLVAITDVTAKVRAATSGLSGKAYADALQGITAKLEKECADSDRVRCDLVSLYHGGIYDLYKYRRYQDVRLVFAPELAAAFFGGDPDNFNFPRYDFDVAVLRVYEDGRPVAVQHYFPISSTGARPGELTFVSGHPGGTSRELTVSELEDTRDMGLPDRLMYLAELRGFISAFRRDSAERARIATDELFSVENSFKARRGQFEALVDKVFFASKLKAEQAFRAQIATRYKESKPYDEAYAAIAKAMAEQAEIRDALVMLEGGRGFNSRLFDIARILVRAAVELKKPNETRLKEYTEAALPQLEQELFSAASIHPELESATLSFSLTKLRERLGADHPAVRQVLGNRTPAELAATLVKGSRLADVALRRKLYTGGESAVAASRDPMIELARLVDPAARAVREKQEDEIDAVVNEKSELLAKARFDLYGTRLYPDATFTLRLSFGKVVGWEEKGRPVNPITTLAGAFERQTGAEPFVLPQRWLASQSKLNLATPFNFCTDNDIVGGNSGSPVLNEQAQLVGVIFDGNIHSLGGQYGFNEADNRAVAVDSAAILELLDKVYGATRLLDELVPKPSTSNAP